MRILVFSQFFPPEIGAAPNRIYEHAKKWAENGHSVTVVTNVPNSPFGRIYRNYRNSLHQREMIAGVEVTRVWTLPSGKKNHKVHRIISFLINLLMTTIAGFKCRKPDLVLSSAPYLTGIPGVIASKYHQCPFVYEMRDPWIQVAAANKTIRKNGLLLKLLSETEIYIASCAKKIIVIGNEMANFMRNEMNLPEKPEVIWNGVGNEKIRIAESKIEPIALPELSGKFVVGMIGNLGNQYDFNVILEAAAEIDDEDCCFMFLGEGRQKEKVQAKAKNMGLSNVVLYPAVPANEVPAWFMACDVTVVSMKNAPIFDVYLPKKVLDSLIFGVPVLFGGSGEVKRLLEASKGGETFFHGDKETLIRLIREIKRNKPVIKQEKHPGSIFVKEFFSREVMAIKYEKIFLNTMKEHKA